MEPIVVQLRASNRACAVAMEDTPETPAPTTPKRTQERDVEKEDKPTTEVDDSRSGHTPPRPDLIGDNTPDPQSRKRKGGTTSKIWKIVRRLKGNHPGLADEYTHVCQFALSDESGMPTKTVCNELLKLPRARGKHATSG